MAHVSQSYEAHVAKIDTNGNMQSVEVMYIVTGAANEEAALSAVRTAAPGDYRDVPRSYIEISSRDADTTFHVRVIYEYASGSGGGGSDDDDDTPTMSFDCGGGTKHITRSLKQRHFGSLDAGGLIGWNGKTGSDMQIAGVDVPTAQLREEYTKTMQYSEVTDTKYKRKVAALVGCVNKDPFKGWNPGEVMFLGNSFSTKTKHVSKVQVTFHFVIQMNEKRTVKVDGTDKTVEKSGFEYTWLIPKTSIKDGVPVSEIEDFYVDQVVEAKDFSVLGV